MKKSLLLLFMVVAVSLSAEVLQLGKIEDYTVIIPSKPTKQERYSAALLAEYLKKLYKVSVAPTAVKSAVIISVSVKQSMQKKIILQKLLPIKVTVLKSKIKIFSSAVVSPDL